jgi:hypothetical protein
MRLLDQVRALEFPASLPESLLVVEQAFDAPRVDDVVVAARAALEKGGVLDRIAPGASVAVGVGSRGIANIAAIAATVVAQLRGTGAEPFIFPAMGSHGGATAAGQRAVLAELGVTPERVGAEVRATMEAVEIGQVPGGPPLFQDAAAAEADHTLLIARVKPHTDFRAEIESGLAKMAVIGMGKRRGAELMHVRGAAAFKRFLAPAARVYAAETNLLGGLAILENAYDETAAIEWLPAAEIGGPREATLLERAKGLMSSLPFPAIDVLVVRRLGKNISGTGMDTNILGRLNIPREPESFGGPDLGVIALLDLTEETHGNACGVGLANVTTARVAEKIDWVATYTNVVTSGIFSMYRGSLPITMAADRQALQVALRGCGQPYEEARWVFIEDTLHLSRMWASANLAHVVEEGTRLTLAGEVPLAFTPQGVMSSPWQMR